jgi:hypothetical protein
VGVAVRVTVAVPVGVGVRVRVGVGVVDGVRVLVGVGDAVRVRVTVGVGVIVGVAEGVEKSVTFTGSVAELARSPELKPLWLTAFPQPVSDPEPGAGGAVHRNVKTTKPSTADFGALWVISRRPPEPLIVLVFVELDPPVPKMPPGAETLRPPKCWVAVSAIFSVYSFVELTVTEVGPVSVTAGTVPPL